MRSRLLQAYEGLQHEQFTVTENPGEAIQVKKEIGVEPGYLLWVSNFYPYKQAEKLINGYARLNPEIRRKHPLIMVGGEWDGRRAAAQAQSRALGLDQDIKFPGWVSDGMLAPLFRQAALHVLPSREETFGRTVIEAMACGTPVVVNDIPIMHEVTAGHACIVDFDDAEKVAAALARAAQDVAYRAQLRKSGLARAQDFTFEKFTSERIVVIQKMVSALKAGRDFKWESGQIANIL
jgi:glycosyltransferase involved in cell wall biosynthesis